MNEDKGNEQINLKVYLVKDDQCQVCYGKKTDSQQVAIEIMMSQARANLCVFHSALLLSLAKKAGIKAVEM